MKEKEVKLTEGLEMLRDGTHTIMMPFILGDTETEPYMDEVIRILKRELKTPKLTRIYLLYQQGITMKKAKRIWKKLQKRDASIPNLNSDRCKIFSFLNVPLDILQDLHLVAEKVVVTDGEGAYFEVPRG